MRLTKELLWMYVLKAIEFQNELKKKGVLGNGIKDVVKYMVDNNDKPLTYIIHECSGLLEALEKKGCYVEESNITGYLMCMVMIRNHNRAK